MKNTDAAYRGLYSITFELYRDGSARPWKLQDRG